MFTVTARVQRRSIRVKILANSYSQAYNESASVVSLPM